MPLRLIVTSGFLLSLATGCALTGRRGPAPAEFAAARDMSQQGLAAVESGNWDQAETLLRKSIETTPSDATSRRYLAEALWRRGAMEDALDQMEAAVDADGSDPQLAVRSGEMLLAANSLELAAQRAEHAIRLNPKSAAAWALRGRIHMRMNKMDRALADFQRALEYAPKDRNVLHEIAEIYQKIGQPTRCLTTLHQLIETFPPGQAPQQVLMWEGVTLRELGRGRQAAESLAAASRAGPPNIEILSQLAQVQAALGENVAAQQAAQQALAIDPSHAPSRELIARLAEQAKPTEPLRR